MTQPRFPGEAQPNRVAEMAYARQYATATVVSDLKKQIRDLIYKT